MQRRLVKSDGCSGNMGKQRRPCPINSHASTKAAGGWGPRRSALPFGFASKPSSSAPWARGLLSASWERGCPDLPACGLWRGSINGPVRLSIGKQELKTLARGQASRGGRHQDLPGGSLTRLAPEEAESSSQGTSRGAHDASHDDQGLQPGASPRSVLLSPLVQRGEAEAKASGKGYHSGATRPRPAERQYGGHHGAQAGVIVRVFGRRGPTLVRISVLDVPLQNGQLLAPFPLNIWEEARGLRL